MQAPTTIANRLLRLEAVCEATGDSRSALYAKAARGLMTKPIKIGAKASAIPAHEVEAINGARIAGKNDDELRQLVERLHAERVNALKIVEA